MSHLRTRYVAPLVLLAVAAVAGAFLLSTSTAPPPAPTAASGGAAQGAGAPGLPGLPVLTATAAARYPLLLHRDDGRELVIRAAPRRIVSLSAGSTEILFAIGAGVQVVGVGQDSDYPPQAAALRTLDVAAGTQGIAALRPDLVVVVGASPAVVATLDALNVPVLPLSVPATVTELEEQIQFFGDVTGHLTEALHVSSAVRQRVDAVQRSVAAVTQGPRVYVEVGPANRSAGASSLTGDLLRLLKAQNVVTGAEPYPLVAPEALVAADPQVLVLPSSAVAGLQARPGWSGLSAVRDGRVLAIDPVLLTRPGPRLGDVLQLLAQFLYPPKPPATP